MGEGRFLLARRPSHLLLFSLTELIDAPARLSRVATSFRTDTAALKPYLQIALVSANQTLT
jgi:hypothetical protein